MNWPLVLYAVAAILSVVALVQSRGAGLLAWAVLAIAVGLLWGKVP